MWCRVCSDVLWRAMTCSGVLCASDVFTFSHHDLTLWRCPRPGKIPLWLIIVMAFINETLWNYLGVTFDAVLSKTTILYCQRTYYFNSSKAARDLGYKLLVTVPQGLACRFRRRNSSLVQASSSSERRTRAAPTTRCLPRPASSIFELSDVVDCPQAALLGCHRVCRVITHHVRASWLDPSRVVGVLFCSVL